MLSVKPQQTIDQEDREKATLDKDKDMAAVEFLQNNGGVPVSDINIQSPQANADL